MPRNPNKTRCAVPGCRSWAMRGRTHCRAHLDAEIGPRGAGAPRGNLNNLQHGAHSTPLSPKQFQDLTRQIMDAPDDLPYHLGLTLRTIQSRLDDPILALIALRRILPSLISGLATLSYEIEISEWLAPLHPADRAKLRARVNRAMPRHPEDRLRELRKLIRAQKNQSKPHAR